MRIDLNLSPSQSFRHRHVLAWALPLFAISLALLIRLGFSVRTNWTEYRSVGRSVDREQGRRNELAAREAALKRQLDQPENRALLREVQFINSVIDQRQFSFTEMEAKVTALLPPEVRLTALSMPDSVGEPLIHIGIEGSSEGPVETFLISLEDSADFRDTMITGSGFDEKGNGTPVGISCTARYVSGRAQGGRGKTSAKLTESTEAVGVKSGSKPGTSPGAAPGAGEVSAPSASVAPRPLTTAPRVAAGLAAARAHPGVPVKIGQPGSLPGRHPTPNPAGQRTARPQAPPGPAGNAAPPATAPK